MQGLEAQGFSGGGRERQSVAYSWLIEEVPSLIKESLDPPACEIQSIGVPAVCFFFFFSRTHTYGLKR